MVRARTGGERHPHGIRRQRLTGPVDDEAPEAIRHAMETPPFRRLNPRQAGYRTQHDHSRRACPRRPAGAGGRHRSRADGAGGDPRTGRPGHARAGVTTSGAATTPHPIGDGVASEARYVVLVGAFPPAWAPAVPPDRSHGCGGVSFLTRPSGAPQRAPVAVLGCAMVAARLRLAATVRVHRPFPERVTTVVCVVGRFRCDSAPAPCEPSPGTGALVVLEPAWGPAPIVAAEPLGAVVVFFIGRFSSDQDLRSRLPSPSSFLHVLWTFRAHAPADRPQSPLSRVYLGVERLRQRGIGQVVHWPPVQRHGGNLLIVELARAPVGRAVRGGPRPHSR